MNVLRRLSRFGRGTMWGALGIVIVVTLIIKLAPKDSAIWSSSGEIWKWYQGEKSPSEAISPLITLIAGLAVAGVTLARHFAQTNADRQRRITDSFSKAIDQLGSDKLEVRLGGIYSLERISKESPDDHWAVMETLTAFARERARRKAPEQEMPRTVAFFYESAKPPSPRGKATDIAAVLTVIARRSKAKHLYEDSFDLSDTDLEKASLYRAIMTGANLSGAYLADASLEGANLSGANLSGANLTRAALAFANLSGAYLHHVDLTAADMSYANLSGAWLQSANLPYTNLFSVNLAGAVFLFVDLSSARNITQRQLDQASGEGTTLPSGLTLKLRKMPGAPSAGDRYLAPNRSVNDTP